MLESNNLKKLVDQEIPFEQAESVPIGIYKPIKKCVHGMIICLKCDPANKPIPAEKQL